MEICIESVEPRPSMSPRMKSDPGPSPTSQEQKENPGLGRTTSGGKFATWSHASAPQLATPPDSSGSLHRSQTHAINGDVKEVRVAVSKPYPSVDNM